MDADERRAQAPILVRGALVTESRRCARRLSVQWTAMRLRYGFSHSADFASLSTAARHQRIAVPGRGRNLNVFRRRLRLLNDVLPLGTVEVLDPANHARRRLGLNCERVAGGCWWLLPWLPIFGPVATKSPIRGKTPPGTRRNRSKDQSPSGEELPGRGLIAATAFLRTEPTVGDVASARNTSNARVTMDAVTPYATPQP